jgi:lysozyme
MTVNKDLSTRQQRTDIIQVYEDLKLKAYICPTGYPTIGYGHRLIENERIGGKIVHLLKNRLNYNISKDEADRLFLEDIRNKESFVKALVKVPLNENQFSALVSFVFNVGQEAFRKSTLLKLLNAGDYSSVPKQLDRWVYGTVNNEKVILGGLKRRREAEGKLFMGEL